MRVVAEEADDLRPARRGAGDRPATAAEGAEIVFALGGDGTLLRAAELARPAKAPLLGINLGKVGFLAEAEIDDLDKAVRDVVGAQRTPWTSGSPSTSRAELRRRADRRVVGAQRGQRREGRPRAQMLELLVDVDGRPLSRYGCDGVVCATPTGSTAYAFSAGGPVVWPEVEALLLVPISAHALFSRPLVTAPTSTIAITVDPSRTARGAVLRRAAGLRPAARARG